MLRRYLASNALPNIQIAISAAARRFRVLSALPTIDVAQLEDDAEFRDWLRSKVVPFAFQDDKGWDDNESLRRAKAFCENVGVQLWSSYISKKNFDLTSWPENRLNLCALGMEGLGLTFAFPHSIPKASLPLLWARGNVTAYGNSLFWKPLFPNADS
jgi:hypothetical protein